MENIHDGLDANVVVDSNAVVDANAVVDTNAGMDSRSSQRINGANHRSCSSRQRQQFIGAAAARRRRVGSVQRNLDRTISRKSRNSRQPEPGTTMPGIESITIDWWGC